jgi:hypothetical protein
MGRKGDWSIETYKACATSLESVFDYTRVGRQYRQNVMPKTERR